MPRCIPERPGFGPDRHAERDVWEALERQLPPDAILMHSVGVNENGREREIDLLVLWPHVGIAAIEVKGGRVSYEAGRWYQQGNSNKYPLQDPVTQVQDARHMLQRYLGAHLGLRNEARFAHLLALPCTSVPRDWEIPGCSRSMVIAREDLDRAAEAVRGALNASGDGDGDISQESLERMTAEILRALPAAAGLPQPAAEHEAIADQLTRDQGRTLNLLRYQKRAKIIGGAGSGKTWLALEQTRRLAKAGKRVALLCYGRGLSRYFARVTGNWKPHERPAHVGMFHDLPLRWGAHHPLDPRMLTDDYYNRQLPRTLMRRARRQDKSELFDAIVVDEGQDFESVWWEAILLCLKDPAEGGLFVFSDDSQRIFNRKGNPPVSSDPFVLGENVRNTKQIAALCGSLSGELTRPRGLSGAKVRLVEAPVAESTGRADDAVAHLTSVEGWAPGQVALLTTKRNHPEQQQIIDRYGWDGYWDSFLAADSVFYGNVLGFKGLERPVVVLAVNGFGDLARAREILYAGLSRARSLLVVAGPRQLLEEVGGPAVARRLGDAESWDPPR
ncbi:NERD domain-containing protein [Arthrobacter mobilis]|uniref:NERD nuclease n=1 Tax=Arthrobacter mobilis TaxID=2724944 RepID=A0A7X6HEC1_9MICC|nr:NERD domain-containing protein [Arthrobacter mobilis]NKX55496.1 NERD nuclease [Arthrobacter mobilis]